MLLLAFLLTVVSAALLSASGHAANPPSSTQKPEISAVMPGSADESHVYPGEFAYATYLRFYSGNKYSYCGGVILDSYHILTAARCIPAGKVEIFRRTRESKMVMMNSSKAPSADIFTHNVTDLAILRATKPMKLERKFDGSLADQVWLPNSTLDTPPQGAKVTTVGWGSILNHSPETRRKRKGQLTMMSDSQCRRWLEPSDRGHYICADRLTGADIESECYGDMGVPLIRIKDDGRHVLVGVQSYDESYHRCKQHPALHVSVAHYVDWIKATISRK